MTFEAFEHDRKMPINDFVFLNPFFFLKRAEQHKKTSSCIDGT